MAINRGRNRKNSINVLTQFYSGKFGTDFVMKVRNGDSLLTKYPDRSGVELSGLQQEQNRLFSDAVAYAKDLISDEERREELKQKLKKNKMHAHRAPYHAAIQQYMKDNAPAARKETIQQTLETYLQTFGLTDRQFEGLRHLVSGNNLTNALYQRLNKVSKATATRDLQEMVCSGVLKLTGKGAGAKYSIVPLEQDGD